MNIITPQFIEIMSVLIPKVFIATICGFIIGYDRELKQKVAGIRTNILICVGCAILTYIAFYLSKQNPVVDPTRIIGQIITGIESFSIPIILTFGLLIISRIFEKIESYIKNNKK